MLEQDFRDVVRTLWSGWIDGREPQRGRKGWGSGKGAPDMSLGVDGRIVPCELKKAKLLRDGRISVSDFDDIDQNKWHDEANRRGIFTFYLVGLRPEEGSYVWKAFPCLRPTTVHNLYLQQVFQVGLMNFTTELAQWIRDNAQWTAR